MYPNNYPPKGPQGMPPDNYLVWAILTTILCCLPFGIVAIVYSSKVDSLWNSGYQMEALNAANKAKNWSIAAALTGIFGGVIYLIFVVFLGLAGAGLGML